MGPQNARVVRRNGRGAHVRAAPRIPSVELHGGHEPREGCAETGATPMCELHRGGIRWNSLWGATKRVR
eukprot:9497803-Pyramimonas_sp.AAC.1